MLAKGLGYMTEVEAEALIVEYNGLDKGINLCVSHFLRKNE